MEAASWQVQDYKNLNLGAAVHDNKAAFSMRLFPSIVVAWRLKHYSTQLSKLHPQACRASSALTIRKSHKNAAVSQLYKEFLGEANGHKAHELIHTHYSDKSYIVKGK